jgi:D-amino-acid dehydrogenase
LVREFAARANAEHAAAVWFPDSSHVVDPAQVLLEVVSAACRAGAQVQRAEVRSVESGASVIKLLTTSGEIDARQVVVCAGVHSAELLRPRGYRVPLLAARGYFVESVGDTALGDAPVVYANQRVVVTPMTGRLRLTGMMEFDRPNHPGDPRLIAILREHGRRLGYRFADTDASWTGSRPVLPDYLPAMGLLPEDSRIAYAFGHQHVGLTMAPQTADLLTALLQGQPAPIPIESFDLQRF